MHILCVWFHPTTFDPREEETFLVKLGSNPSPLASHATALSITPLLLTLINNATKLEINSCKENSNSNSFKEYATALNVIKHF